MGVGKVFGAVDARVILPCAEAGIQTAGDDSHTRPRKRHAGFDQSTTKNVVWLAIDHYDVRVGDVLLVLDPELSIGIGVEFTLWYVKEMRVGPAGGPLELGPFFSQH